MYFKNRFPMYEGDSYIHASPVRLQSDAPAPREDHLHLVEQARRKPRRGAARALLLKVADWLDRALRHPRRKELEDYLAHSSDLADLERRLQRIERDARFIPS